MKISNQKSQSTSQSASTTNQTKVDGQKSDALKTSKSEGSSQVNVSPRAQQMLKAKEIASGDSIDEAKVQRLQKLIDDGNYKVDAEAIADRMVDTAMAFPD